jgi:hypothetical protein
VIRPEGIASGMRLDDWTGLEATCQRCHETLREADRYCPSCGLPQLIYVAAELPLVPFGDDADVKNGNAVAGLAGLADGIAWRPALRAALMLAIPAGVLCSGLIPIGQSLGMFWIIGAAAWAVSLYSKRTNPGRLSMGNGARIGLVTGLFASWLTLSVNGVALWVARFVLHQGGQMDSMWANEVDSSLQLSQQMVAQMGMTAAQATQSTQFSRAWMLSAEGRAGIALSTFVAGAVFLVLFAMIGGALGARWLAQPRRT